MTEPNSTAPIFKGAPIKGAETKSAGDSVSTSLLAPNMDLGQLAGEIGRQRRLIAAVAGFFTLAATIVALGSPETFRADALIQIENDQPLSMASEVLNNLAGSNSSITTELELLRSRLVLGTVVKEQHYQIDVSPRRPWKVIGSLIRLGTPGLQDNPYPTIDDQIGVADLTVPNAWGGSTITIITGTDGHYRARLPDESEVEGQVGQTLQSADGGMTMLVDHMVGAPGKEFYVRYKSPLSAVQSLRDSLQAGERGRQTGLIELFLDSSSARDAQTRLDAIVNSYIETKAGYSQTKAQRSLTFVEAQIPPAEAAIRRAEDALVQYQRRSNTVDVKSESELLVKQIREIGSQLDREQIPRERERLLAVQDNLRQQAQQLPVDQQEVANLTLELQTAQQIYVQLMNRVQEMRVLRASAHSNVRLVDTAVAPAVPVAPRRKLIIVLGLMIGLFLGITAAGFRLVMRPTPASRRPQPMPATAGASPSTQPQRRLPAPSNES